jgi:hypothetical protein
MLFDPYKCPECGEPARGVLETVSGLALLDIDEDGSAEYAGETKMYWDSQVMDLTDDNMATLGCPRGHQWQAKLVDEE